MKNWLFCCDDGEWRSSQAQVLCRNSSCGAIATSTPAAAAAVAVLLLLLLLLMLLFPFSCTRVQKVFGIRCCGRSMLLCVDSVHHMMARFICVFLCNFYRKLSQVHAGVNLPFFRADGRILGDYFQRKHSNITRITNSKIQKMFRRPIK